MDGSAVKSMMGLQFPAPHGLLGHGTCTSTQTYMKAKDPQTKI